MIYLDNHATTVCAPSVLEAMLPFFSIEYGNPASNHTFGQVASLAVDKARWQVANLIGAQPEEILLTSGATESNNIALLGLARRFHPSSGKQKRIVTTEIEHKAVLSPLNSLRKEGWEIVYLDLENTGYINLERAKEIISNDTFLLTVQSANSEIGTLQPITDLAMIAQEKEVIFHCDAAQSIGKVPIDLKILNVHFLSFSSHKLYGPKGVGALYIRGGINSDSLTPLMFGGGHHLELRPGTLPVPLIVGFGEACQLCLNNIETELPLIQKLRDEFETLLNSIQGLTINGCQNSRLPHNSSITFPEMDAEILLANLPEIIASTGAACESGSIEPSRILKSIGLTDRQAYGTIRFGLGRYTQREDIIMTANQVINVYKELTQYYSV